MPRDKANGTDLVASGIMFAKLEMHECAFDCPEFKASTMEQEEMGKYFESVVRY